VAPRIFSNLFNVFVDFSKIETKPQKATFCSFLRRIAAAPCILTE